MSSANSVGKLRSDDPETEMTAVDGVPLTSGMDEGNQAMIGNFHLTGNIDPSSTYGSPRSVSNAVTFGQSAGAAHPNFQLQGYNSSIPYNSTNSNSAGFQPTPANYRNSTGFNNGMNGNGNTAYTANPGYTGSQSYGQTNFNGNNYY